MLDLVASLDSQSEIDSYSVHLIAGEQYFLEVECGGYGPLGHNPGYGFLTLPDSYLELFAPGPGLLPIASNDDGGVGSDARIVFTPATTGIYRLDVQGYQGFQTGSYRIKALVDEFRGIGGTGPAGVLLSGQEATGAIDYVGDGGSLNGDVDLFDLHLVPGLRYRFEARGAATGDGTLLRPELQVADGKDTVLGTAFSASGGGTAVLTFRPLVNQPYYLAVQDWLVETGGTYRLIASAGMGTAGDDVVAGLASADAMMGLDGNDDLRGMGGEDGLDGGRGNDRLNGGAGDDELRGGAGDDHLLGGRSDDRLEGGAGRDVLNGGTGWDVFVFTRASDSDQGARDVIRSWDGAAAGVPFEAVGEPGGDLIDLHLIDADAGLTGDQAFVWGGGTGVGHLWLVDVGEFTVVRGNIRGDAAPEFELLIRDMGLVAAEYVAEDFSL